LIAAELRRGDVDVVDVHAPDPCEPGRRDWTVELTTPLLPLTVSVLTLLEEEMLAVERRWPGSRLLGWTTCPAGQVPAGAERAAAERSGPPRTQRELVVASLLRCPPATSRGAIHGRGAVS
jgi:hypothetical protein